MKSLEFKLEAIKVTLKAMDNSPDKWMTFNDKIHTYIIDKIQMKSGVQLFSSEVPILECVLENDFLLITTERLVSSLFNNHYEMYIKEVIGFSNEFVKENNTKIDGKLPKTNIMVVKGNENKKLLFKIDSYHPAYFVKILIYNLSSYIRYGSWYLNPSKTYGNDGDI